MKFPKIELDNPDKKPLNELIIATEAGKYKALHEKWVIDREFSAFPLLILNQGKLNTPEALVDSMESFNEDLLWILRLNHHRFWSQVVYDNTLMNSIVAFLQDSLPFYLPINAVTGDQKVVDLYQEIAGNVMRIICRLITNKESETSWMPKEFLAQLLYKNYLISIPMLFDLVAFYGPSNNLLLKKIFDTVFKIEPKYLEDLKSGIKFIQKTFETLQSELEKVQEETRDLEKKYEDLTMFLMNSATTLNLILDLVPGEMKIYCSRTLNLETSISRFYENFIPKLFQSVILLNPNSWFLNYVNFSRIELINCYRNLLNRNVETILNTNQKALEVAGDEFLSALTESAGHKIFISDYAKVFPVECDLDILEQSCKKVDKIKLDFVRGAFLFPAGPSKPTISDSDPSYPSGSIKNGYPEESQDDFEGACALPPADVGNLMENQEDKLVQETQKISELFPDFGTGYIRKLLSRYDFESEKVIAGILENNLDQDLRDCDQSEPYIPPEVLDPVVAATGIERLNIYDGDEFDVMRRDEFGGIVKKHGKTVSGKEPRNLNDLLNDKSHVQSMKSQYEKYSLVTDGDDEAREYDDEYDDSYDAMVESEPKIKLAANMKNVLVDDVESEEELEEEPDDQSKQNNLDFCENPEVIRARREQQYQQKIGKKLPQKNNEWRSSKDVVGGQKGQGQSADVLRNRQNKNTNKSSRANHNRKQGASFKQSKGMF